MRACRCYLLAILVLLGVRFPTLQAQTPPTVPGATPADSASPNSPTPDLAPPAPAPEQRRFDLMSSWTDGLRFRSADDAFNIHVGGNGQIDSTWLIGPNSAFALPNNGG